MRALVTFFVRYPIWANAIIIVIGIFGVLSYTLGLKKSFFPERTPQNITITMLYPGASPEEVEEGVTVKIEEAIKGIVGIDEVTSVSSENSASISIKTLDDYDLEEVTTEVKNAVDRINSFPLNAEPAIVFKEKATSIAMFMGVKGNVSLQDLKLAAEKVEDDFLNSGLISQVRLSGFPDLEISIDVPEASLRRYGITFDQVAIAVRSNNRDISGGSIKTTSEEIKIRANSKSFDPSFIEEIIIRANPDGTKLLLRDVADVQMKFADLPNAVYSNNERAVSIIVSKLPEEDIAGISSYVDDYVNDYNAKSSNIELFTYFNFNEILQERLVLLTKNFGVGLFLVLVTLGLFLSLRLSFWVAAGIPLSFLFMFIVGDFAGITINMLSLFGMLLVVGILVDDGIVIAENIYTHFEKGKDPQTAAIDGTMEMVSSVFTSVTTTIVVFTSLIFLDNGGFTKEMAIVVIACLAFSMVEAFFVLPAHLSSKWILSKREKSSGPYIRFRKGMEKAIDWVRIKLYARLLSFFIKYRWASVTLPLAFFIIMVSMLMGGQIKFSIFPVPPADDINVNLVLKPGTRENITESYLRKFQDSVWAVHEEIQKEYNFQDSVISTVDLVVGSQNNGSTSGSHVGRLGINFENLDEKNIAAFDISNRIRKKIGDVPEAEQFSIGNVNYFGKPISVSLKGRNITELESAKAELKDQLDQISTVKDVTDNASIGQREIKLELKPLAYFLGLTHQDITKQIRQGFFGEEVQRLQIGTDEVKVWVRYPQEDRLNIAQLESMKIKMATGAEYPLTELANYTIERGVISINHFNGKREIRVEGELAQTDASLPDVLQKITEEVMPPILAKYPGIEYTFEGQSRRAANEGASFLKILVPIVILLFLIVTLNFRSLLQAVMIIVILIPLGFACAVFGHWVEGAVFYATISGYGILALSGVIINDAVVMLDRFNHYLREGMSVIEAAYQSGIARFRAIILTSLTTVAGLYPLILETSFQAQFIIPMAISLAWGVLMGTFFILLFFPVIVLVVTDMRVYFKWFIKTIFNSNVPKPKKEEVEPAVRELQKGLQY
ncbi:MAG: efflux RND transporter permease subunit [Cyclobacteriaceae bacterium]